MGKRQRRRQREGREPASSPSPPSAWLRALERGMKVMGEIASGETPENIIRLRRDRLRTTIAPYDAVHLLSRTLFNESPLDADSYVESEHDGNSYVVELLAAEIALRPDRAGNAKVEPAMDGNLAEAIREYCKEAAIAESLRRRKNATGGSAAENAALARAAQHDVMLRNPGWEWQEESTLRGLFNPLHLAKALKDKLGFNCEEALSCTTALTRWTTQRVADHMNRALATVSDVDETHPACVWASGVLSVKEEGKQQPELTAEVLTYIWAWQHAGEVLLIDADDLASIAEIDREASAAFLEALSSPIGQTEQIDWFRAAEEIRFHPILDFGDAGYLLTMPGNDLWALRPIFESALANDAYRRHRSDWLEAQSKAMLDSALTPDESYSSVDIRYVDDNGRVVEGEMDVLIRVDDVAIVVEAKSTTMRPGARRGGEALIDHLKKTLTKAAEQAEKAREALRRPGSLSVDGRPLELGSEIREIHPVVVTLDDLSAVAPVLWEFAGSRIMPEGITIPWVVTLNELDAVAQTVEWPAQFVHFLRRRSRMNDHAMMVASDELDWWMHYLTYGLYFEDDDKSFDRQFVMSLTDPLDAWMLYTHGPRSEPAPMPQCELSDETRAFLSKLATDRRPGTVVAACAMLEVGAESQAQLWEIVRDLRKKATKRRLVQRCSMVFEKGVEPMMVLVVVVPDGASEQLGLHVEKLLAERVEELGPRRTLALGFIASSRQPFDAMSTLEKRKYGVSEHPEETG